VTVADRPVHWTYSQTVNTRYVDTSRYCTVHVQSATTWLIRQTNNTRQTETETDTHTHTHTQRERERDGFKYKTNVATLDNNGMIT